MWSYVCWKERKGKIETIPYDTNRCRQLMMNCNKMRSIILASVALIFVSYSIVCIQSFSPTGRTAVSQSTSSHVTTTSKRYSSSSRRSSLSFITAHIIQQQQLKKQHGDGDNNSILLSMVATSSSSTSSSSSVEYPPASDGEALQSLFAKHCNDEGLMTEREMRNVPAIKDMLVRASFFIYYICLCLMHVKLMIVDYVQLTAF